MKWRHCWSREQRIPHKTVSDFFFAFSLRRLRYYLLYDSILTLSATWKVNKLRPMYNPCIFKLFKAFCRIFFHHWRRREFGVSPVNECSVVWSLKVKFWWWRTLHLTLYWIPAFRFLVTSEWLALLHEFSRLLPLPITYCRDCQAILANLWVHARSESTMN